MLRDGGVFLSNREDHLVVFLFGEGIEEGDEGRLDGLRGHEGSDDGYFMDGVDAGGQVVGVEFFLEEFEGVEVLHAAI